MSSYIRPKSATNNLREVLRLQIQRGFTDVGIFFKEKIKPGLDILVTGFRFTWVSSKL